MSNHKGIDYPPKEAWDCIKEELKDYIPKLTLYRWSDEIIPEAKALTRLPGKKEVE